MNFSKISNIKEQRNPILLVYYTRAVVPVSRRQMLTVELEKIEEQMGKGWAPRGLRGVRDLRANTPPKEYLPLGAVLRELSLRRTV